MRLSIIIPTLNEAGHIAQAVERALALNPYELFVADGGSVDGTPEIVRRYPVPLVAAPRGRARQQNAAATQASGDVLLFLHADTWLSSGGIEQIAAALADSQVVGGGFQQRLDADGFGYRWLERGNALRATRFGMVYGDQGIFVRREVFAQLGGFPETSLLEDWLFMKQLRRQGRVVLLPGPLWVSARRWRRHGIIRQTAKNWLILAAARLGVSPDRLARYYRRYGA